MLASILKRNYNEYIKDIMDNKISYKMGKNNFSLWIEYMKTHPKKATYEDFKRFKLLKKEGGKMKFTYRKENFFDEVGWIKFDTFNVAVGQNGELEYCDPLKNKQYYEQNPYYTIVSINNIENDIQNDTNQFERIIQEKYKEEK